MDSALVWISGASSGIGQALVKSLPWSDARIIGISRRPAPATEHLQADLSDPSSWPAVARSFCQELDGFTGEAAAFVHAAGTLEPMGFAAEVDMDAYTSNVLLNSASPQVLGQAFVSAARNLSMPRYLAMITSGAASSVYPGWSSYGAAKASVDQWVRNVGAEQDIRGGVRVLSIAPGTVDTGMQALIRETPEESFPQRKKFIDLHGQGKLSDPAEVARQMWGLLQGDVENGSVVDLRKLADSKR